MKAKELLAEYAKGRRDFRGVDLEDVKLRYAGLSNADPRGADLSNAWLSNADPRGAKF